MFCNFIMCALARSIYNSCTICLLCFFQTRNLGPSVMGNFLELFHWSFLSLCAFSGGLSLFKYWTYWSAPLILFSYVTFPPHLVLLPQLLFKPFHWLVISTAVVFVPDNFLYYCCSLNVLSIASSSCCMVSLFPLPYVTISLIVWLLFCFVFW